MFAIQHALLHNLVDMRVTCIHLLKVASDGNFYLLFGENYLHLASAKFEVSKHFLFFQFCFQDICSAHRLWINTDVGFSSAGEICIC